MIKYEIQYDLYEILLKKIKKP